MGFKQGTAEPAIYIRSTKQDGSWTPTRTLWHSGNFSPGSYATKATTLAGCAISDAYTKTDTDNKLAEKRTRPLLWWATVSPMRLGKMRPPPARPSWPRHGPLRSVARPRVASVRRRFECQHRSDPGRQWSHRRQLPEGNGECGDRWRGTFCRRCPQLALEQDQQWQTDHARRLWHHRRTGPRRLRHRYEHRPNTPIDTIGLPGGFYSYGDGPTSFARYSCLVNIPYGRKDYAAQIGFKQGTTEPTVLVRSVLNDGSSWTPTRELWHNGNLDVVGAVVAFACSASGFPHRKWRRDLASYVR